MFFKGCLDDFHSWGWEMVQFACTILMIQRIEAIQRKKWALSFWVEVWQPKPRIWTKKMVLWREDAGDWVDLSPFNCVVTPYISFESIYSVHLLPWARLPLSLSRTTDVFTCILSDIAVLNPGCKLESSGGGDRQSWYPTKSDIWVGAQAYVFFFFFFFFQLSGRFQCTAKKEHLYQKLVVLKLWCM